MTSVRLPRRKLHIRIRYIEIVLISIKGGIYFMRNAKQCGCSFSQTDSTFAGERIRVNGANSCGCGTHHCHCEDSCRPKPCPPRPRPPKPCPPRPCPSRPCPPRPCPPRPRPPKPCPSCEDRCASQYRNCMRNCRWDRNDCGCDNDFNPYDMNDFGSYDTPYYNQRNENPYDAQWDDSYENQNDHKSFDEQEEEY